MRRSSTGTRFLIAVALGAAAIGAMAFSATAKTRVRIRQTLTPTAHAPGASGQAKLQLKTGSSGKFSVRVRHLPGHKSFDVLVNKVKVGTIVTGGNGSGSIKLSTAPKGHDAVLGFDPQGDQVEVRDGDTGDNDLEGNMPDNNPSGGVGCCLTKHDGETECEVLADTDCSAHNGTPTAATSCLPDPCGGGTPPPAGVVCCLANSATGAFVDDAPEVECQETSESDCAAQGGMAVQGTSCDPNPCQPVSPPGVTVCCVPDGGKSECEQLTPDHCQHAGGAASTATSCDPDPCGGTESGNGGGGGGGDGESGKSRK
jgi:hypothetical protein